MDKFLEIYKVMSKAKNVNKKHLNLEDKWEKRLQGTLFHRLQEEHKRKLQTLYNKYAFTHQELRKIIEVMIDFQMWDEGDYFEFWSRCEDEMDLSKRENKSKALKKLDEYILGIKSKETEYYKIPELPVEYKRTKVERLSEYDEKDKIMGLCPVASKKTVCCNLQTLDAVKNCGFGCSYCAIQTMFTGDSVYFDKNFKSKLEKIEFDRSRLYHVGTGQSSDALMWGDSNGILEDLFGFARKWPNVLLEFKTKSRNVNYLVKSEVPKNIFCTWTINPNSVIQNEEHLTASFEDRVGAARKLADKGIRVGFHFHPMVYFKGWKEEYQGVIEKITSIFTPEEVAFVSFGTLTFPRPIIKKIRNYNIKSKILQMPMVSNPEGKLTYPDEIKEQLFCWGYRCFSSWHKNVFFYLCMEEEKFWRSTFGEVFSSNEVFEETLLKSVSEKMGVKV